MSRSWGASQPKEVAHELGKTAYADRLLDVPVESRLEGSPPVVVHREGGDSNHRNLAVVRLADLAESLGPVDAWKLQIHQDEVRGPLVRQPDTVLTRGGLDHLVAGMGQHIAHQFQVLRVVLDHQDAVM